MEVMGRGEDGMMVRDATSRLNNEIPSGVSEIKISRAALQSWASLRGRSGERVAVRRELIDEIDELAVINSDHPEWMTTPRSADAWAHLPGDVSLILIRGEVSREWIASACVAPRGVRRNAPGARLYNRVWSSVELEGLLRRSPDEVIESARFSKHCAERVRERSGRELEPEELADWVRAEAGSGAELRLAMAPDWAASGARMPALVLSYQDGDELALLIAPEGEEAAPVIATAITREWAEQSVKEISESVKIEGALSVELGWDDEKLRDELSGSAISSTPDSPGHWMVTRSGLLVLVRPSGDGWTAIQAREVD